MTSLDEREKHARELLERIIEDLEVSLPQLIGRLSIYSTDSYPLNVFASLSAKGLPFEEDVVLSATIKNSAEFLVFTSDISTGDGLIIREGPHSECSSSDSPDRRTAWTDACFTDYFRFLEDSKSIVVTTLRSMTSDPGTAT